MYADENYEKYYNLLLLLINLWVCVSGEYILTIDSTKILLMYCLLQMHSVILQISYLFLHNAI